MNGDVVHRERERAALQDVGITCVVAGKGHQITRRPWLVA